MRYVFCQLEDLLSPLVPSKPTLRHYRIYVLIIFANEVLEKSRDKLQSPI